MAIVTILADLVIASCCLCGSPVWVGSNWMNSRKTVQVKKISPKPLPVGDVTRTARSARHRDRLTEAHGKRVVVDMPAPVVAALDALLSMEYGATQKEVVCNALLEVAAKRLKRL